MGCRSGDRLQVARLGIAIMAILVLLIGDIYGLPIYTGCLVKGRAPIDVDGDLRDWEGLSVTTEPIGNYIVWPGTTAPSSPDDLSGSFQAIADHRGVYFSIEVRDDVAVFGEEDYVRRWNDDSIEVFLDGDMVDPYKAKPDANDLQIRLSLEEDRTVIEGVSGLVSTLIHYAPPGMWESMGVEAAIAPDDGGYTAEVYVPAYLIGTDRMESGVPIGANVRVMDDDDGGGMDRFIDWSDDQENLSSELKSANWGRLMFGETACSDVSATQPVRARVVGDSPERGTSASGAGRGTYDAVQAALSGESLDEAIREAVELADSDALPLLAAIARSQGEPSKAIVAVTEALALGPTEKTRNWLYEQLAGNYFELGEYEMAEDVLAKRGQMQSNPVALLELGDTCRCMGAYRQAIGYYQDVMETGEAWQQAMAHVGIARCYVQTREHARARRELDALGRRYSDDRTAQGWRDLLLASMETAEGKEDVALERCKRILQSQDVEKELEMSVLLMLGRIHLMQDRTEQARRVLERIVAEATAYPEVLDDATALLWRLDQREVGGDGGAEVGGENPGGDGSRKGSQDGM